MTLYDIFQLAVEICIQTDEIILLSPEEDVRGITVVPVDGSVLIEQIGPLAVVSGSEPPHLDSLATQGGSMGLAQTDHSLVASPGMLVGPSAAAGQDELPLSSLHATQGRSVESSWHVD